MCLANNWVLQFRKLFFCFIIEIKPKDTKIVIKEEYMTGIVLCVILGIAYAINKYFEIHDGQNQIADEKNAQITKMDSKKRKRMLECVVIGGFLVLQIWIGFSVNRIADALDRIAGNDSLSVEVSRIPTVDISPNRGVFPVGLYR